ncbi:MAG TPA: glycosyltransferase family 2 protein [Flavisolibacter sp.]|nr:glycosyltransferase family 2 protein [Flavisolibacter sp.]
MDQNLLIVTMPHKQTPLVSVIIPFYNEEEFFAETIDSVIHQEYDNWEAILVDDNGSEQCTAIAKNYEKNYPGKIVYADHPAHANRGPAASRNLGIARAKGELIAFLDADDVWLPNKLKQQVQLFQQHPDVSMVCETSTYWYSWEKQERPDENIAVGAAPGKYYTPPALALQLYPLGKGAAPCPSSIVITKAALLRNGCFEESFIGFSQAYEDQAFLIKIYLKEVVYISDACNNLYRQRSGSAMHRMLAGGNYQKARCYFLHWLANYRAANGMKDAAVNRLLQKALYPCENPKLYNLQNRIYNRVKRVMRLLRVAES